VPLGVRNSQNYFAFLYITSDFHPGFFLISDEIALRCRTDNRRFLICTMCVLCVGERITIQNDEQFLQSPKVNNQIDTLMNGVLRCHLKEELMQAGYRL
jgi:hypothetical protein